jgi:hypothetical protein
MYKMGVVMTLRNIVIFTAALALIVPALGIASHHYHGYGCKMGSWNMSDLDTNNDAELTFEEFIGPQTKKWRAGYEMIDTNADGIVDQDEWKVFLEIHNIDKDV